MDRLLVDRRPIVVGILHSETGPMAVSERSMIDAEVLALEEINRSGGLLGRPVRWVIADGASDWPTFARQAERLIHEEGVQVIFGCWTSACRKGVLPVVEAADHLLLYPMAYEGLEQSPNIVYTGAAPNQQITPAVQWCHESSGPGDSFWSAPTTSGRTASTRSSKISSPAWGPSWSARRTSPSARPMSTTLSGRSRDAKPDVDAQHGGRRFGCIPFGRASRPGSTPEDDADRHFRRG